MFYVKVFLRYISPEFQLRTHVMYALVRVKGGWVGGGGGGEGFSTENKNDCLECKRSHLTHFISLLRLCLYIFISR